MFANQEACLNVSAFFFPPTPLLTNLTSEAWHDISKTDALVESGEESGDEYTRADYGTFYLSNLVTGLILMIDIVNLVQRLKVINRLSRQQWTNEQSSYPQEMDTDLNY
jgi:hypothetical protein